MQGHVAIYKSSIFRQAAEKFQFWQETFDLAQIRPIGLNQNQMRHIVQVGVLITSGSKKIRRWRTSNLSERGIFCWVTTVWGTTPRGDPTVGSGPIIVGMMGPGAKYGLYVLPTWGIPVRYGLAACHRIIFIRIQKCSGTISWFFRVYKRGYL